MFYSNPFYKITGPLGPSSILSEVLQENPCDVQYLFRCLDNSEEVCNPCLHPAISADIDLPSCLNTYYSYILYLCFNTAPWTSGDPQLNLTRAWNPLK